MTPDDYVAHDGVGLAALVRAGFPFVVVGTAELVRMEDKPAVRVVFPVEEGMRWLMAEVRGGVLGDPCGALLREFFRSRRSG